ncbi:hypothetical protein CKO51_31620 [Rhodopirellula sp. SM50]|nr:hypothetical protein CKO51_31620 [Rhodopirellula sp. SM50]
MNHRSIVVIDPSIVVDPSSTIVPSMKRSIANRTRSDEEQKPKSDVVTRNPPSSGKGGQESIAGTALRVLRTIDS